MTKQRIREAHQRQAKVFRFLRKRVKDQEFVYPGSDGQQAKQMKLKFLRILKTDLKRYFWFNDYQAEFVKNEAISQVLYHRSERLLILPHTKEGEKLVHTAFVLGRHYFRFIMTMFD